MKHLLLSALLLLSCVHANKTHSQEKGGKADDKGGAKTSSTDAAKEKRNNQTTERSEAITTSKTTNEMFKEEGLKKLQHALAQKAADQKGAADAGLNGLEESGKLDAKTQEALRAFQKAQKLPDSGLPDYETIRRLGIKPEEVYQHAPPSQRVGVQ